MSFIVTEITQGKKNAERVNVFLNGRFWVAMYKNELLDHKLSKGVQVTDEDKLKIETQSAYSKKMDRAYRYLQLRPRSVSEVRSYLVYRVKLTEEETEHIISDLQQREALSDEKFAQWYTEYKLQAGVHGLNKIKTELMQKGVNSLIISKIIEKYSENEEFKDDQQTKIKEYAEKIVKTIKSKDAYDLKTKLINRLLSRGFKYVDIKNIVNDLIDTSKNYSK